MSGSIEVFKLATLAKQITETPEKRFLNISKGSEPKADARSSFHPSTINVIGYDQPKRPFISITSATPIYNTPKDPASEERKPGEKENNGFGFTISSKACPDLGVVMATTDRDFRLEITRLKDSGDIKGRHPQGFVIFNTPYSANYSHLSKKKDIDGKSMAGKPREDPLIKIKGSFDKYPERHPTKPLQNTVKTAILDYRTKTIKTVTNDGKTFTVAEYAPAMVNGQPVDSKNIHLFITPNSRLMEGSRLLIEDCSNSAFGFTLSLCGNRLIIDPGQAGGFTDELIISNEKEAEEYNRAQAAATSTQTDTKLDESNIGDVVAAIQNS